MTLSAFLCAAIAVLSPHFPLTASDSAQSADSLDTRPIHSIEIYSDNQWASNAATKWVVAGLAFGGDITSPVRTLTSRTAERGTGVGGGLTRQGVALVLPPMNIGEEPDKGRWRTTVALEHMQLVSATWSPGMATFFFGRHGIEGNTEGWLGTSTFRRWASTSLKVGGIRTHRTALRSTPVDMTLNWSVNAGEVHLHEGGSLQYNSRYQWDGDSIQLDLKGSATNSSGVGTLFSLDLGIAIEEAEGEGGRPDRWSFSVRDWGSGRFGGWIWQRLDTSYAEAGLPVLEGAGLDFSDVIQNDTILSTLRRRMPKTVQFQWDRESLRMPGVVWSLRLENNRSAPRGQAELVRSSGRGAVRTTVGIGYGGWGGTYIPLDFEFATRDVRQGRPGGTLAVSTRWLALPGSGGRMALGLNWHQTF